MYNVINENRTEQMNHNIENDDRLLSMERESFYYASKLMHVDSARQEKRAYITKYKKETGKTLSQLMLRFKEESSQCTIMLQGFKRIGFSAR